MQPSPSRQLLDAFPLLRSHSVDEASASIGRVFSPHRLALRGRGGALDVQHNQIRLADVSINVLRYGADVEIDPGERGDFYLAQMPLAGRAELCSGRDEAQVDTEVLSVLRPRTRSRMRWSGDCTMLLVQVPRGTLQRRAAEWGGGCEPRFALSHPRRDPAVAAWWQAVLDLTANLDRHGREWLRHPAAAAAMEGYLLSAFSTLLCGPAAPDMRPAAESGDTRCLRRAKEFVHANPDRALTLAEIARHACVGPRTLEEAFRRHGEPSPMAYARRFRLQAVHEALRAAGRQGRDTSVTALALAHGFVHMGRFAAQYRARFGCPPSDTLRGR
jgi:AraC-like DNA-binding protein